MQVSVNVHAGRKAGRTVDIPEGSNYYDLLSVLEINPETVVILLDGTPVAFDAPVQRSNSLDVIRVVSGG